MGIDSTETQKRVQRWFRAKRRELLASAELAEDHASLIGSHREFFTREFLRQFLPGRLSADRGLVYNFRGHSGECDVVIWDSSNFPRLSMLDHSSFFAESVVAVVEIKSNYTREAFDECRTRCRQLHEMSLLVTGSTLHLRNELVQMWHEIYALREGLDYDGAVFKNPSLAYVVVFLRGGTKVSLRSLIEDRGDSIEDEFPDSLAFVEAGTFVRKFEPSIAEFDEGENPSLLLSKPGEDVLMLLADELLRIVARRSFGTDGLYDLGGYKPWRFTDFDYDEEVVEYRISRFPTGYNPFFSESREAPRDKHD